ncbi:MAG: hypothetical protein EOO38_16720, partial [Cytophagaceae bacterium]
MERRSQALKIVRHHARKEREEFPHYYPIYRGTSHFCTSIANAGALVGAQVFSDQGDGGCTTAVVTVVDVVRISAILVVALMIRALLAITTKLRGTTGNREWPRFSGHRARHQDYMPVYWPFTPSTPPGPSKLFGTRFSTPRMAASLISVGEKDHGKSSFTKQNAALGGPPAVTDRQARLGEICTIASLAYLEPDDANISKPLTGGIFWENFVRVELRAAMGRRINSLVWPESPRQVAAAIRDAYKFDWFNELQAEIPRMLGTRALKMHAGSLIVTENSTYISTRGN